MKSTKNRWERRWLPWRSEMMPDGATLYHNNRYHVIVRTRQNPGGPDLVWLSIRDNDRTAKHDWREMQRIKNELMGQEVEMVEMYPRESQLVDYANQYHLWGFMTDEPVFTKMGLGWAAGRLIWDGISPKPAAVADLNTDNAVQRPMEEVSK